MVGKPEIGAWLSSRLIGNLPIRQFGSARTPRFISHSVRQSIGTDLNRRPSKDTKDGAPVFSWVALAVPGRVFGKGESVASGFACCSNRNRQLRLNFRFARDTGVTRFVLSSFQNETP